MIKKLQRKVIFLITFSVFIVLAMVLGAINAVNIINIENKSDKLINLIMENKGRIPKNFTLYFNGEYNKINIPFKAEYSIETPFETRYFSVKVLNTGNMIVDIQNIASISYIQAIKLTNTVLDSNKYAGYTGIYKYKVFDKDNYKLLVFLDRSRDIVTIKEFLVVSCLVGLIFLILVMLIATILSKKAIKPFIESVEKQKRFITDAGHEIKTPLAIIFSNTEVIEMYNGENEWTQSIKNQINRLNELVKGLLTLSKMDESNGVIEVEEFLCGMIVYDLIESFETLFLSKNIKIYKDIDMDLTLKGNKNDFYNLISILLDNASKYTSSNGQVKIYLKKRDSKIEFITINTCDEYFEGDLNYLFDRFYRIDNSRSRDKGGYGIGLSIANSIVRMHKGKISAVGRGNEIIFRVIIPQNIEKKVDCVSNKIK